MQLPPSFTNRSPLAPSPSILEPSQHNTARGKPNKEPWKNKHTQCSFKRISYTHLFIPPYFRAKTLVLYRKNGKRIYMNGGTGTTQANKPMWNRDIRGRWVSHTPRLGRERGLKKRKKHSSLTHHLWVCRWSPVLEGRRLDGFC